MRVWCLFLVAGCAVTDPATSSGGDPGKADGDACEAPTSASVIAPDQVWPRDLAVGENAVFWATAGAAIDDGAIWTAPCGGDAPHALATGLRVAEGVAIDDDAVYWVEYDAASPDGRVMKVDRSGGAPVVLAGHQHGPHALILRGDDVVFLTLDALARVPKDGSSDPVIVSPATCPIGKLAADEDRVYWSENCVMFGTPRIVGMPWSTGVAATVVSGEAPGELAVDASGLYWAAWTLDGVEVRTVPPDCAGCAPELVTKAGGYGGPIAVDPDRVFFTGKGGDGNQWVYVADKAGGAATEVAESPALPSSLRARGERVVWASQGAAGAIHVAPVP